MSVKKGIGYACYGLAVTVWFLFWLFPPELLKNFLESSAATHMDARLTVDEARLVFPSGIHLEGCRIVFAGKPDGPVVIDTVDVMPDFSDVLRGRAAFAAEGKAYGGTLAAHVAMEKRFSLKGALSVDGAVQGIALGTCEWIQSVMGRRIEGALKGTGDFRGEPGKLIDGTGRVEGVLFGGALELMDNELGFDRVSFDRVDMRGDLKSRTFKITALTMVGREMSGELDGSIYLDRSAAKTRIALKGHVTVPALNNKKIPLTVGGTAADSAIRIRKM